MSTVLRSVGTDRVCSALRMWLAKLLISRWYTYEFFICLGEHSLKFKADKIPAGITGTIHPQLTDQHLVFVDIPDAFVMKGGRNEYHLK